MRFLRSFVLTFFLLALPLSSTALADEYSEATEVFKKAKASGNIMRGQRALKVQKEWLNYFIQRRKNER